MDAVSQCRYLPTVAARERRAGERAAAINSLIGTAKLNGLDLEAYLRLILARITEHPINCAEELLPWNVGGGL